MVAQKSALNDWSSRSSGFGTDREKHGAASGADMRTQLSSAPGSKLGYDGGANERSGKRNEK
jgi:hypothetical protein